MNHPINLPIPLEGALNIRELGGYPANGKITKTGVFLRADSTHALTGEDMKALSGTGVTLVIDMRSPGEVTRQPSRFFGAVGVEYHNIIMLDGLQSLIQGNAPTSLAEMYIDLLGACAGRYAQIFRLFLNNKGVSLFHCMAGKDRTGVVAMLLLQLAGVSDEIIIGDYAVSEKNLGSVMLLPEALEKELGIKIPAFFFTSPPEEMKAALEYLVSQFGGAAGYLAHCGLSGEEIDTLRNKLI